MKINKYNLFAYIYFFVNSLGLPLGLLYTSILSPLFYIWLYLNGYKRLIIQFFLILSPFILAHFVNGVELFYYLKSSILLFTFYLFGATIHLFIKKNTKIEETFHKILFINFILVTIAIIFFFTPYRSIFWLTADVSFNLQNFARLTMFTYEPSYYSTLLVPLVIYYSLRTFMGVANFKILTLGMILLPLLFSFSLGVISALIISLILLLFLNLKSIFTKKRVFYFIVVLIILGFFGLLFLFIFYKDNPLFVRINSVFIGMDSSARGRTTEAFKLSFLIAKLKSIWFGVGLGQLKIIGHETISAFYDWPVDLTKVARIPNAFAETLATFGIVGAFLRLFFEIYFFFKTKVLDNYFRTWTFLFIFIYQFSGSYLTNIAELVIWIFAFTPCFPQFNKNQNSALNSPLLLK